MIEIVPSAKIIAYTPDLEKVAEICARTCYKSEDRLGKNTKQFLGSLLKNEHLSVFEHNAITVDIVCDRGVSHELVRHRLASFSQTSTRYCDYGKKDIEFIKPSTIEFGSPAHLVWIASIVDCERSYKQLIGLGCKPEIARSVLPNSLATNLKMTANAREWMHIFKMRTAKAAHPDCRIIMCDLLEQFKEKWPVLFGDLNYNL